MGLVQTNQDSPLRAGEGLASPEAHGCPVAVCFVCNLEEEQLQDWQLTACHTDVTGATAPDVSSQLLGIHLPSCVFLLIK